MVRGTVAQQPILGKLVVGCSRHLRQPIAADVAGDVVVAHYPCGGGAGAFRSGDAFFDGEVHVVANPVFLGEFEVEHLAEFFGRGIPVLMLRRYPGFGDGECRRIILVEHLAPFAIDVVHFVPVIQRMRAVGAMHLASDDFEIIEIVTVEILGQAVRHIHAEAVRSMVEPEVQGLDEIGAHVRILPIPIGLFDGKHVQIPLSVGHSSPSGSTEAGNPVGGWLVAVRPFAVTENITVSFR